MDITDTKMVNGEAVQVTAEDIAQWQADQAALQVAQAAEAVAALKASAQAALNASDMTAIRCVKAGVAFPAEWQSYVSALRAIISSGTGTFPARPAFPANT